MDQTEQLRNALERLGKLSDDRLKEILRASDTLAAIAGLERLCLEILLCNAFSLSAKEMQPFVHVGQSRIEHLYGDIDAGLWNSESIDWQGVRRRERQDRRLLVGRALLQALQNHERSGNEGVDTVRDPYDVSDRTTPYRGLESYTFAHRAQYAGHEGEVERAMHLLTDDERVVLFVSGPSGSGKSSFAQAALLPKLNDYYDMHHGMPRYVRFRPGSNPLRGLANALFQLGIDEADDADPWTSIGTPEAFNAFVQCHTPADQVNLILIDQLEELFTQSDPAESEAVLDILAGTAPLADLRTHVIATVRADYLPSLFANRVLLTLWQTQGIVLQPMTREELEQAITRPLEKQNARLGKIAQWEPQLLTRLAADASWDATLLPLLQVTLENLWQKGRLTSDNYGTLADALQEQADAALTTNPRREPRDEAQQAAVMAMLLDLVSVSLDIQVRGDARLSLPKNELTHGLLDRANLTKPLASNRRGCWEP